MITKWNCDPGLDSEAGKKFYKGYYCVKQGYFNMFCILDIVQY